MATALVSDSSAEAWRTSAWYSHAPCLLPPRHAVHVAFELARHRARSGAGAMRSSFQFKLPGHRSAERPASFCLTVDRRVTEVPARAAAALCAGASRTARDANGAGNHADAVKKIRCFAVRMGGGSRASNITTYSFERLAPHERRTARCTTCTRRSPGARCSSARPGSSRSRRSCAGTSPARVGRQRIVFVADHKQVMAGTRSRSAPRAGSSYAHLGTARPGGASRRALGGRTLRCETGDVPSGAARAIHAGARAVGATASEQAVRAPDSVCGSPS